MIGKVGGDERRRARPFQFTVRAYLGAAVVMALFLGTAAWWKELPAWTAVAAGTWLGLGGMYLGFRASRALAALALGPVVVTVGWCLFGGFAPAAAWGGFRPVGAEHLPGCALGWGAFLSLWVVVLGRSGEMARRFVSRPRSRADLMGQRAPLDLARWAIVGRTGLAIGIVLGSLARETPAGSLGLWAVCLADAPWAPFYMAIAPRLDSAVSVPAGPALAFFWVTLAMGVALHAGMGWLAAYGDQLANHRRPSPSRLIAPPR